MLQWVSAWVPRATALLMMEDHEFCRNWADACPDFTPMFRTNQERLDMDEKCVFTQPSNYMCVVKFKQQMSVGHSIRLLMNKDGLYVLAVYKEYDTAGSQLVLTIGQPIFIPGSHGMVEFNVYTISGFVLGSYRYHVTEDVTVALLKYDLLRDLREQNRYPAAQLDRVIYPSVHHMSLPCFNQSTHHTTQMSIIITWSVQVSSGLDNH
jgi:hypothetical protein